MTMIASTLGYPRIGAKREMKVALEKYWSGKISQEELLAAYDATQEQNIKDQVAAGIDLICAGDMTMYDHVLDWVFNLGLVPERFLEYSTTTSTKGLDLYFAMCRGQPGYPAMDMTKWFDTNYHNEVPELSSKTPVKPDFAFYLSNIRKAIAAAGAARIAPFVLGPVTLLRLARLEENAGYEAMLERLLPAYVAVLGELKTLGVPEVQLHEPALVLSGAGNWKTMVENSMEAFAAVGLPIHLVTYFDDISEVRDWVLGLPIAALSLDFTRGDNFSVLQNLKCPWPTHIRLGAGVVDARSPYKSIGIACERLQRVKSLVPASTKIAVQPSASLMFVPVDLSLEQNLPKELVPRLSFARQKLCDLVSLASGQTFPSESEGARESLPPLNDDMFQRSAPFAKRSPVQKQLWNNVMFPTSTIGSFPQVDEMRRLRLKYRKNEVNDEEYQKAVDSYIAHCIGTQLGAGLDVLVHGEPERSDMVEYFGEKMDGFAFTAFGWVQSYGSRYVRPPIIYADVARSAGAMTVREWAVAQRWAGSKPVKGMLTGPTTILNWSFPRQDISRATQCWQIALALRQEIADLEAAGCRVVQVDEPALREGLPLRQSRHAEYLDWTVKGFRLATAGAAASTRVVTHFCYSEFGDIIKAMGQLDADEITIETSRSGTEGLQTAKLLLENTTSDLSPGIYDIHSPVVPTSDGLVKLFRSIADKLPAEQRRRLGIVPDCGLKTRKWAEVTPSIRNMTKAATALRESFKFAVPN